MARKQAVQARSPKIQASVAQCAITLGRSLRHFEIWYRNRPDARLAAVWRNETGPVKISFTQHKS